jgi:hypothetical protein
VPEQDVLLQLRAAQVEKAMAKTQLFRGEILVARARHGNRRRRRGTNDSQPSCPHFDCTRLELRIAHRLRTRDDFTLDEHDGLRAKARRSVANVGRTAIRIERYLDDSRAISQVDEGQAAEITASVYPTSEANFAADMSRS